MFHHKDYQISKEVSTSPNSIVYLASRDSKQFAIKQLFYSNSRERKLINTRMGREVEILQKLNHQNVIHLIECMKSKESIVIVLEYCPMNLGVFLKTKLRPSEINYCCRGILAGLDYLHSNRIIHRDIKPSNILLTYEKQIKIADFGLSRFYDESNDMSHQIMSRWYRAPEILFGSRRYDYSVDIWSFGCLLYELIHLKPLFPGESDIDQICIVFDILGVPSQENWPEFKDMPDYGKICFSGETETKKLALQGSNHSDTIIQILQYDRKKRPSAKQLLDYFNTIAIEQH